jgi:CO/xanthine dehydrogenase Mo-binding subunit
MSDETGGLQRWLWPATRAETGVVIRIGRALHWLGYGFAGFVLLIMVANLAFREGVDPAEVRREVLQRPAHPQLTATIDDLLQNQEAEIAAEIARRKSQRESDVISGLLMILGSMAFGRVARYILANE